MGYANTTMRHARLLHDALIEHGRLTRVEWRDATGLTSGQFDRAKEALDHALQLHLGQPTSYDPVDWSYFLPGSLDEARPWLLNRMSDATTRLQTIGTTLDAAARAWPEHERRLRWWSRQVERMHEDVSQLVADLAEAEIAS